MDFLIVFLLIVIGAMIAGAALYVPRELRRTGGGSPAQQQLANSTLDPLRSALETRYEAELERLRTEAQRVIGDVDSELGKLRETLRSSTNEQESQIVRLREHYAEVDGNTTQALEHALSELRSHHDAEFARLRDAVGAAIAAIASRQTSPDSLRRATLRDEAIGDLYRRLSKLETSLVSIANPVLLPGEPFSLPAELPGEALKWEHWKDVGNAMFGFAESFAHHRLELDDATCRDLTKFVSDARDLLTRSIYPNLQSAASNGDSRETLRTALQHLGDEFPRAREGLEQAYRDSIREN